MNATLALVQLLIAKGEVLISQHAYDRLSQNGIAMVEVELGASNAVVVEDYPTFHKGPSILVLQTDANGHPVHVVWGIRTGTTTPAVVVTAYRPDPSLWSADFRSRK